MRVARLNYLNCAPFYWGAESWELPLVGCVPSELGRMAAAGEIDAGPMAVADWFGLEEKFEPVGPFGIASRGPTMSVILFSMKPIERLDGARVGVTGETSTSARLLRLLLERRYGVHPKEYRRGRDGEAWLLIGDAALAEVKKKTATFVYDLGDEWTRWRNLPFVFARWVVRGDLPPEEKQRFRDLLDRSFKSGMEKLREIGRRDAGRGGLAASEVVAYLKNLVYVIGAEEKRGLAEFRRMAIEPAAACAGDRRESTGRWL
jgi:chorismate dehydratase